MGTGYQGVGIVPRHNGGLNLVVAGAPCQDFVFQIDVVFFFDGHVSFVYGVVDDFTGLFFGFVMVTHFFAHNPEQEAFVIGVRQVGSVGEWIFGFGGFGDSFC